MIIDELIVKIKSGESPLFRFMRRCAQTILYSTMPVPKPLKPLFALGYRAHFGTKFFINWLLGFLYRGPLFQARCASVGKNLHISLLPEVRGPVEIHLGDNVSIFGANLIESSDLCGVTPQLIIGNRVDLGHGLQFLVNREVRIDDDVNVANFVRFMDSDDFNSDPSDPKPIHVCRYAWIGQDSFILKGVTIGEGAVIGVNSVVKTDIPPYSVAMGNPARVVVKNVGGRADSAATEPAALKPEPTQ